MRKFYILSYVIKFSMASTRNHSNVSIFWTSWAYFLFRDNKHFSTFQLFFYAARRVSCRYRVSSRQKNSLGTAWCRFHVWKFNFWRSLKNNIKGEKISHSGAHIEDKVDIVTNSHKKARKTLRNIKNDEWNLKRHEEGKHCE